jgi:pyruvate dehydrogenase E1 component
MSETRIVPESENLPDEPFAPGTQDVDPTETAEWLDALDYVLSSKGPERIKQLLTVLDYRARRSGVELPAALNTPYINSIAPHKQPPYPGNREIERRIKSIVRWNAMAMVSRQNKLEDGIGGHITFSAAVVSRDTTAIRFIFRAMPRRACTPAPFWKAG